MPFYRRAGLIPAKRHTQFRQPDGGLYFEELFSTAGFSGVSSLLYHCGHPAETVSFSQQGGREVTGESSADLRPRSFDATALRSTGDAVTSRVPLLFNRSVTISLGTPDTSMAGFARNAVRDELIMIHEGTGELLSPFGSLRFGPMDLILIPRSVTVQWRLDDGPSRMFTVESVDPIDIPTKLRNEHGQLLESSPFCERDIRTPELPPPVVEVGAFPVRVQHGNSVTEIVLRRHPFDVVGWDGYTYPYALNMLDVEPVTGSLHQMPDQYQVLGSRSAAVCVMPPHFLDYHPLAVPSPPVHNNVDSDEVLFLVAGTVPGRKPGPLSQITLHPAGLAHGPKDGAYEASIGTRWTDLLAFMVDTFEPLQQTAAATKIEDASYYREWLSPG